MSGFATAPSVLMSQVGNIIKATPLILEKNEGERRVTQRILHFRVPLLAQTTAQREHRPYPLKPIPHSALQW